MTADDMTQNTEILHKRNGNGDSVKFSPSKIVAMLAIGASVLTAASLWFGLQAEVKASQKEISRLQTETDALKKSTSEMKEMLIRIDWRVEELWKRKTP